jgi:hypothetical protein
VQYTEAGADTEAGRTSTSQPLRASHLKTLRKRNAAAVSAAGCGLPVSAVSLLGPAIHVVKTLNDNRLQAMFWKRPRWAQSCHPQRHITTIQAGINAIQLSWPTQHEGGALQRQLGGLCGRRVEEVHVHGLRHHVHLRRRGRRLSETAGEVPP